MPEQMDRLNFYTALYSVKSLSEIEELNEEMLDRFGVLPEVVKEIPIPKPKPGRRKKVK
jgi:transcription-repair coupling factor (superfamily II helicase)